MRAVSLFSGVGGMDLGLERAGIETVLQCELDDNCRAVLERHWPDVRRIADVRDVGSSRYDDVCEDGGQRLQRTSQPDLVHGGFPCQDISVAGKRGGLAAERSGLWFEFWRVVSELRPSWVVVENVPGLLSSNGGADFATVLAGLDQLGFDAAWAVLDAQHFGVPQRRRRVFIVAGPRGRGAEQVLSLCESCGGNPQAGGAPGEGTAGSFDVCTDNGSARPTAATTGALTARAFAADGRETYESHLYVPMLSTTISGGAHPGGLNGQEAESQSLVTSAGVRRLTPRECERLMGWPDDWTRWRADGSEVSDSQRYRMCGNGVVSTVAEWIGHRLMAVWCQWGNS